MNVYKFKKLDDMTDSDDILKNIKFSEKQIKVTFLPRRQGLGYKTDMKQIDSSHFKSLIKKQKKVKSASKNSDSESSEIIMKRGTKK